jgi:uncharacterized protein (TIRG00374 family)
MAVSGASLPAMLGRITKVSVTVFMLWLLFRQFDWDELRTILADFTWWSFVAAIAIQVFVFILGALRWRAFFRHENLLYTVRDLLRPYFIGALFNNFLPAATGGDVMRVYYILRKGHGVAIAASPVITERIIGTTVMFGIAASVLPFISIKADWLGLLSTVLPMVFMGLVICLVLLRLPTTHQVVYRLFRRWEDYRPGRALLGVIRASHRYLGDTPLVLRVVSLSISMQLIQIVVFWMLATGIGSNISFIQYALAVPLILIVAALPISIGGLGVREAAVVTLFGAIGMETTQATAVAILFLPVLILSSLPGLYYFLTTRNHNALLRDVQQDRPLTM